MLGRSLLGYELSQDLAMEESGQKGYSVPKIVCRKTAVMLASDGNLMGASGQDSALLTGSLSVEI